MHTADPASCLWTATAEPAPATPPLAGDRHVSVAVIGAGYTGLSAALHLAEKGIEAAVLEAGQIGAGASGRNNGQVIPAYARHDPDAIEQLYGPETGARLNEMVGSSADLVFELVRRYRIACDAVQKGWIQPAHRPSRDAVVRRKYEQWERRNAPVALLGADETRALTGSIAYRLSWLHRAGGHVQPLSLARGMARAAQQAGAAVHANTPALRLDRQSGNWRVRTPSGTVSAESVVLATNAYTGDLWPGLAQTVIPFRSFQVATAPLPDAMRRTILPGGHGMSDTRTALYAFRWARDGRLVTTGAPLVTSLARRALLRSTHKRFAALFPQFPVPAFDYVWEGKVAMTHERLPRLYDLAPGLHAALGYSGRGIALATAMGRVLAERVAGAAPADLPMPVTIPHPLPLHGWQRRFARAALLYYRWRDARD